jgi:hypothetical protein
VAIKWKDHQAKKVASVLEQYPPQSNKCELAARAILPVARQLDASSRAMRIDPVGRARYLLPKVELKGDWWRHHVTTEVTEHYVDSLTHTPGTPVEDYFRNHYQYGERDAYVLASIDP